MTIGDKANLRQGNVLIISIFDGIWYALGPIPSCNATGICM